MPALHGQPHMPQPSKSSPERRTTQVSLHPRSAQRLVLRTIVWACILLGTMACPAWSQDGESREYKIKAAYLYNLGRYITWPQAAFANRQAPFVIGVMEPELVSEDLEKIAQVKTIDGRPIVVQRFSRPENVGQCHILFLPNAVAPEIQHELARRLAGSPVLLVGESDDFLRRGGTVAFVLRDNNVRLLIAPQAAERGKLQISSKLLQIAQTQ